MARSFPLLASLVLTLGCQAAPAASEDSAPCLMTPTASAAAAPGDAPPKLGVTTSYGAPLSQRGPRLTLASVLEAPERFEQQQVTLEGVVRRACSRRGCWMELSTGVGDSTPGCRVTFENYGFFVPTDSAGSRAVVEGRLKVQLIRPEMVRHHESEGAVYSNKHADGSATELRLVATGVELTKG